MRIYLILLCSVLHFCVFAQLPSMDHYRPAQSSGYLPKDLLISTTQRYEDASQQIDKGQNQQLQKAEEEFYMQTAYSIDQIRFSGSILVNDSMGMYVNRVADSLLAHDPVLRSQLHIYVLRSPVVNAFATDQGAIFVTVGLLTRLRNEAELAYVLAHEIIHYKRRHVLSGYIEGVKLKEGIGQYEAMTFENRFLKKHRYARNQETQADEDGFELLVRSNYDPHAAITAFDILAAADLPYSDTLFKKSFFESDYLFFPSKFYADTVKPYKIDDSERENDFATHPSTTKRKKGMIKRFGKLSDTTGSYFLVSREFFLRVKMMARFEECFLHTNEANYRTAIYMNYSMQQLYPSNFFLQKEMVRAMYAMALQKNKKYSFEDFSALFESLMSGMYDTDDTKPTGELGRMKFYINKVSGKGWTVMALKYAWIVHGKYPEDKDIEIWMNSLFKELTEKNELRESDFEKNDSVFVLLGKRAAADTTIARKMKGTTPGLKFQAAIDFLERDSLEGYEYWQFGLINEFADPLFVSKFRQAVHIADSIDFQDSLYWELSRKERDALRAEKENAISGPQDIHKVVAVNPIYIAYDYRNEQSEIDVRASVRGKKMLMTELVSSGKSLGVDVTLLDPGSMDSTSVDRFNDLMTINDWFDHRTEVKGKSVLPFSPTATDALVSKYCTSYFMWTAVFSYKQKREGKVMRILGLSVVPFAPFGLYKLFTPREDVYVVAIVYDMKTGQAVYASRAQMDKQRANKERVRLHIYDLMNQLSKPKKK